MEGSAISKDLNPRDTQVGGTHYKDMVIQPSEFIIKNNLDWHQGNVIKYVCRHKEKGGRDDLLKAIHYLQLYIEYLYPKVSKTS